MATKGQQSKDRQARQAEALRANLRRRKEQSRSRLADEAKSVEAPVAEPEDASAVSSENKPHLQAE